jgi:hypothetical protein
MPEHRWWIALTAAAVLLLIAAVALLVYRLAQPVPPCWMPEDMP